MYFVPEEQQDAELLAERIAIRLQHSNSAVVLTTVKVILYLMNYMGSEEIVEAMCRKLSPPLGELNSPRNRHVRVADSLNSTTVTLLSSGYEVQYVALRNIHLIIQRRPLVLKNDVKVFFCKYNDPIYVKLAKLEIIYRLANERNVEQVLAELKEYVHVRACLSSNLADRTCSRRYASEVDVDFVRKAVRSIGRLAIKIASAADLCITVLLALVQTKVSYVVQEAIVVIKDIFRRYPNQYEGIIGTLCENLDALDTPDAKAAMIWILGQYADRIENSDELLDDFLFTFLDEPVEVSSLLLRGTSTSLTCLSLARRCNSLSSRPRSSSSSSDQQQDKSSSPKCSSGRPRKSTTPTSATEASSTGDSSRPTQAPLPTSSSRRSLPSRPNRRRWIEASWIACCCTRAPFRACTARSLRPSFAARRPSSSRTVPLSTPRPSSHISTRSAFPLLPRHIAPLLPRPCRQNPSASARIPTMDAKTRQLPQVGITEWACGTEEEASSRRQKKRTRTRMRRSTRTRRSPTLAESRRRLRLHRSR